MKTQTLTFCLFAVQAAAIWPLPVQYTSGLTFLWLSPNVTFNYLPANATSATSNAAPYANTTTNQNINASAGTDSYNIVQNAIKYTMTELFNDNFVPWRFHPRSSTYEPPVTGSVGASVASINQVNLYQNATDPINVLKSLAGGVNESYTIVITDDGQVNITAIHSVGIIRALETFSQMFFTTADGTGVYTNQAPVMISDYPMFPHRGLNMDVARNYFPVTDIMRTIDALAFNKFNRLHLHATDAQSWPLEIPALPNLAGMGAYQPGMSYSPDDLAQIQTYGAYRGVQVIIETDMPGHTASIAYSRPDLISAFNIQPNWTTYGAEPPTGGLKLNSSAVYDFLGTMFNDLLPRVYPYSAYFHTGGDEVNANVYLLDETVHSNSSSVLQPLLQAFINFTHAKVRAAGLTPVVWEEMLLQWNLTLGSDVVVQTWQSDSAVANTVAQGHKVLAGNYNYWYLDCGKGQWLDFPQGPAAQSAWPYADYCSPTKNWRLMYSYDPLQGVPANQSSLVLGGEVHIWTEQTDPVNLDAMVWPRACAAAEILWSGAKDVNGTNRSQVLASPRLAEMRERMVQRGIGAGPVQMPYCTMNGTQCVD